MNILYYEATVEPSIQVEWLNIRQDFSLTADIIGELRHGEFVRVLPNNTLKRKEPKHYYNDGFVWYCIVNHLGNRIGFIADRRLNGGKSKLQMKPVFDATPPIEKPLPAGNAILLLRAHSGFTLNYSEEGSIEGAVLWIETENGRKWAVSINPEVIAEVQVAELHTMISEVRDE